MKRYDGEKDSISSNALLIRSPALVNSIVFLVIPYFTVPTSFVVSMSAQNGAMKMLLVGSGLGV